MHECYMYTINSNCIIHWASVSIVNLHSKIEIKWCHLLTPFYDKFINSWHLYWHICVSKFVAFEYIFVQRLFIKATGHSLTHWGRATHICVSEIIIIGSDNGLLPGRRQAIIWTNVGILLIGPLGINFSEILIEISTFSFKKMHLEMSSAKWRLFRLGLNVLRAYAYSQQTWK